VPFEQFAPSFPSGSGVHAPQTSLFGAPRSNPPRRDCARAQGHFLALATAPGHLLVHEVPEQSQS
jgi:hypothetical protein